MTDRPSMRHGGALAGLALLAAATAGADQALRDEIHRQYKHQSYMLVEDTEGARLFLFDAGSPGLQFLAVNGTGHIEGALEKTRSLDARTRVLGLVELAGIDDAAALDVALALLADPNAAVRDEAEQLILDHPRGASMADALGIVDDIEDEEE